ncbi:NACHT domain-containing protein [uncultured Sphingomonas sp.]|uniref:NACHT domain-containing protein n=1 Tax=uncultured Sphingomonas sp. TaxID=158754 RepID=UPI0025907D45|nr:NACHT domain-containing protein [uncultured Sphingomonas sp.]
MRRGYKVHKGVVHINGRSQQATILDPPDDGDQSFADIGERIVDPDEDCLPSEVSSEEIEQYWSVVQDRFGRSEGILPEQRAEILTSFVEPKLALSLSGSKAVTWGNLRESSYLLVSGAPGSGKTTLLRQWLLWHADRRRRGAAELLPLCLSLRDYNPDESVETALVRQAAQVGAHWLASDFKTFANRGLLAIGFDGLDEVPVEDRQAALDRLSHFTSVFPRCRYLVTTRPGIDVQLDVGLEQADLLPFDQSRVRQLAYYRLHSMGAWKNFTTRMEAEPALSWIMGNPLALTLVMSRYLRREIRPSFVGEIVEAVIEMFVDTWDSSRGIVRTRNRMLSPAAKRKVLAWVAEGRHLEKDVVLPIGDTVTDSSQNAKVLAMLSEHTGLLKASDDGIWSFSSSVFREYFNATMSVSALTSKAGAFRRLLTRPLENARSHIARFVGFLSSDIDSQILEVLNKLGTPELATAVHLTDVVSQGLPLKRSTLDKYALFVSTALKEPLQSVHAGHSPASHCAFCLHLALAAKDQLKINDLEALMAALHRSRDGIAAGALRTFLQADKAPHLQAIEELLNAEGELSVERSDENITWKVTELMPEVPSGPPEANAPFVSNAIH